MSFRPSKPPPPGVNPQYSSFNYQAGGFTPPSQPAAPQRDTRQPGIPGGSWGEVASSDSMQLSSSARRPAPMGVSPAARGPDPMPVQPAKRVIEPPKPHLMVAAEPGAYERALIDDLTQPVGARARPPDKDLTEFSNKCKFLDTEVVSRLLFGLLSDSTRCLVRDKQKVLYLLERLASDYPAYQAVIKANWALVQQVQDQSAGHSRVVQSLIQQLSPAQTAPAYEPLVLDTPAAVPKGSGLFGALTVKREATNPSPAANSDAGKKEPVFQDILSL